MATRAAEHWRKFYTREPSYWTDFLPKRDPFDNWERNTGPESSASGLLYNAMVVLCGGGPRDLAELLLRRAVAVADRAFAEGKCESPRCRNGFPMNRGELLSIRSHARGVLGEAAVDAAALLQASADQEEYLKESRGSNFDEVAQQWYLSGVRAALIAGAQERARDMLKKRKSFKRHGAEHAVLRALASDPKADGTKAALNEFFELVRDPMYSPGVLVDMTLMPLEVAALHDKYCVSPDGTIDWHRTIEAMRA